MMQFVVLLVVVCQTFIVHAMELKGISSCQSPLLADAKVRTTKNHLLSNTWCPSTADQGSYLFISLANLTYITRANIQSISPEIFYYLHYTRDNTIDSSTTWRSYRLLNNQQATISLDPPIIAKHLRLSFKLRRTSACIQFEFFGCPFTDGVVSYSMLQGVNQLEDETYDGEYDELHRYLSGGLGQLSDGKTGPDNREDIDGLQWVGWRKPRGARLNYSVSIVFTFDTLRNFSRLTIHCNNYFPKHIYAFRAVTVEFLPEDPHLHNASWITFDHPRDDQFEMARPIMIDLKHRMAAQLKVHFYFDSPWLLISEVTFDSFVLPISTINSAMGPSSVDFGLYLVLGLLIAAIILIVVIILLLVRCALKKKAKMRKRYFTPMHNQTDSSVSTTSSEIDIASTRHRYATIASTHPYLLCNNGSITSSYYTKSIPTTSVIRSPSLIQQHHIEGICGNSAFSTQRLFQLDLKENQFLPSHLIQLKQRIDNRHQTLAGGEICHGELQMHQSVMPITIRRLRPDATFESKISFYNEMSLLSSLCHPNIIHAYGFCSEPTLSLLTESFDQTSMDLYQYLQYYNQAAPLGDTLGTLALHLASQLSSALAYLESLHISHRDVAARNCCISLDLTVKLHDLAMSNETYADDYALVTMEDGTRTRRPIRWCAWETICQNRFTSKSDVFSFGVLLWEVFTMADRPHRLLDDDQVLANLRQSKHELLIPASAKTFTDIIASCWNVNDFDRPSFHQLNHLFNQQQQQALVTGKLGQYHAII